MGEEWSAQLAQEISKVTLRLDALQASSKAALDTIEGRITATEAANRSTVSRLEDVYRSFIDRLAAKEETVQLVKNIGDAVMKQSTEVQHQLGLRFNFVTGMVGFIALAFAASFTYNVFQAEKVSEARAFLEDGTDVLTEDAKRYSAVLSGLALGDSFSGQADREFLRSNYVDALLIATSAINALEPLLAQTGEPKEVILSATLYDVGDCRRKENPAASHVLSKLGSYFDRALKSKDVEKRFEGLGPQTLRPAVVGSLFAAYDLHARASFFAKTKDMNTIRRDGSTLLALGSDKWQGYHWIGLAAEGVAKNTEARTCFERSVAMQENANKDQINLAELLFIDGQYDEAAAQANRYAALDHEFISPTDVVARFYLVAANHLAKRPIPGVKGPRDFMDARRAVPSIRLEGTFLSQDLEKALDETRPEGQTFAGQDRSKKDDVRRMKECLVDLKCPPS